MSENLEKALDNLRNKVKEANDNNFTFTLNDLITEVTDEIKYRRYIYGNQVIQGKKTQKQASRKIQAMEKVLIILKSNRDSRLLKTGCSFHGHQIFIEYYGIRSDFREQRLLDEFSTIFAQANNNLNIL